MCVVPAVTFAQGLRLGIYHPFPHLCQTEEASQRDLRVLRLAFGLQRVPELRLRAPWFYRVDTGPDGRIAELDSAALWARPPYRLAGANPELPAPAAVGRLEAWQRWVQDRVSGITRVPERSLPAWVLPPVQRDPFYVSRLAGSALLPFERGDRNGRQTGDCRHWPSGVTLADGDATVSYVLRSTRSDIGEPFRLTAYRSYSALWRAYFGGRLDALLLEGPDLDDRLQRYRTTQLGDWGLLTGTQQIVLRFHPQTARLLGPVGRTAFSKALPRRRLAAVDGPGRFAEPEAFLAPVLAADGRDRADALEWDSLAARRSWLRLRQNENAPDLPELRLAVLEHPTLLGLAEQIQAQWSRTLNVSVRVRAWPIDQFARLFEAGDADLMLDVVDLDDGSLQDLWLQSLHKAGVSLNGVPSDWEAALRKDLPYLPVLKNVHSVLLRRGAPDDLLPRVCPGCVRSSSPARLAPEPIEREDPRG